MRHTQEFLIIGLVVVPACASGVDTGAYGQQGGSGTGSRGVGGTGGGGTSSGGNSTGGNSTGGTSTGGQPAGSGGLGAATTGGSGVGGRPAGSGGLGATGGSNSGGDAGAGHVGTQEPIIPPVSGVCPEFRTGTQTIMGLPTQIVAGTPGATKGPLLFTWHGTNGSGTMALAQLPQSVQQDIVSQGGLVIAPSDNGQVREGIDVTLILGVWYDVADLKYADHIVACAVQNHNIDPRRIYVTGCSAGGLMAGAMTLQRSRYVAAAAPNSGGTVAPTGKLQDPLRVPAVFSMHGGTGDTVIVNFADTTHNLENILKPSGAFLIECMHSGGHCGAPASLHEQAWAFMKAHPFSTKPSPYAGGLPATFPAYCTIQQ